VTSDVSALSSFGANGHQTISTSPPPSLKFRTAGFPQYGFKLDFNHNLHPKCRAYQTRIPSYTLDLYVAKVSISKESLLP
jgi:hypothetical protein